MHRQLSSLGIGLALAALVTASPATAFARVQRGVGIGANVTLNGASGLALDAWVSDAIMLELMAAVGMNFPWDAKNTDVGVAFGGTAGLFGVLAGNETTNLMLGGRIGVFTQINATNRAMTDDDFMQIELDLALRVEHWLDSQFSINAQVGFDVVLHPDLNGTNHVMNSATSGLGATTGLFGGAGFTYYFDPSGPRGAPASAAPAEPAATPAPAPAPGSAPSWE